MRKILIISSQMDGAKSLSTDIKTWAELRNELNKAGISTDNMKAMVGQTKTNLIEDGALLPTNDFTLYLTPGKIKSGK